MDNIENWLWELYKGSNHSYFDNDYLENICRYCRETDGGYGEPIIHTEECLITKIKKYFQEKK